MVFITKGPFSTHTMPGVAPGTGDTAVNTRDTAVNTRGRALLSRSLYSSSWEGRRQGRGEQRKTIKKRNKTKSGSSKSYEKN